MFHWALVDYSPPYIDVLSLTAISLGRFAVFNRLRLHLFPHRFSPRRLSTKRNSRLDSVKCDGDCGDDEIGQVSKLCNFWAGQRANGDWHGVPVQSAFDHRFGRRH